MSIKTITQLKSSKFLLKEFSVQILGFFITLGLYYPADSSCLFPLSNQEPVWPLKNLSSDWHPLCPSYNALGALTELTSLILFSSYPEMTDWCLHVQMAVSYILSGLKQVNRASLFVFVFFHGRNLCLIENFPVVWLADSFMTFNYLQDFVGNSICICFRSSGLGPGCPFSQIVLGIYM